MVEITTNLGSNLYEKSFGDRYLYNTTPAE